MATHLIQYVHIYPQLSIDAKVELFLIKIRVKALCTETLSLDDGDRMHACTLQFILASTYDSKG